MSNKQQDIRARIHRRGICVIIPTYNNGATIRSVVQRAMQQCDDVIVVNDGSTDSTAEELSRLSGVTIVQIAENSGKGVALKRGFQKALQLGFSYAVTLDGDGQHYPEDIPLLVEANIEHPHALIVGQRRGLESAERSKGSKFANAFSNFWFFVQTFRRLRDTQTGFRLYPLRELKGICGLLTSRYEAELELLVFASWHGVELAAKEVNVYYPPCEERVSHFRPLRDFGRITVLNTALCFLAVLYGLPLKTCRIVCTVFRTVYSYLFFLFFTVFVMTPLSLLIGIASRDEWKRRERVGWMLHRMAAFLMYHHGIPGVRYTLHNPHEETLEKPAVIICNHQSPLDIMPMLALHKKIVFITNDRVWRSSYYGALIRRAGFLPASEGVEQMLSSVRELVAHGYCIAIYPEGTRSSSGVIGRFHKGAFFLARTVHLAVVPVTLHGANRVLAKHGLYMRKGYIRMDVCKRVTPQELDAFSSDREAASHFRRLSVEQYEKMDDDACKRKL